MPVLVLCVCLDLGVRYGPAFEARRREVHRKLGPSLGCCEVRRSPTCFFVIGKTGCYSAHLLKQGPWGILGGTDKTQLNGDVS